MLESDKSQSNGLLDVLYDFCIIQKNRRKSISVNKHYNAHQPMIQMNSARVPIVTSTRVLLELVSCDLLLCKSKSTASAIVYDRIDDVKTDVTDTEFNPVE